jgi:cardiolipin synthase
LTTGIESLASSTTVETPLDDLLPQPETLSLAHADRAFARAAGTDPIGGNAVRLLLDAAGNFPAWLAAIRGAKRSILFESYLVSDDEVGREFAEALAEKARAGVEVHVIYDWFGSLGAGALWKRLLAAGAHVRAFNPLRFESPLGWLARDHRKTIAIDGRVAFVTGLCVSARWQGDPRRGMEPWRDTGVEIIGPAVAEVERAFAQVWLACGGSPLRPELLTPAAMISVQGDVRVRVIAGAPNATGTYRLDLAIASLARRHLWLTDAYFVGTAAYVQALGAAARDGVDVRLLVPGASDIPALSPLSRAGYRPLLQAGVRVFEWNGTMLHAKTAVADGFWARIGSTNLNIASWMGNYELDVAIENAAFATAMATQFEADLTRATEIVLTRNRVRRKVRIAKEGTARRAVSGSAGRAAAGAVSVGSALGAALTNRRALGASESGLLAKMGLAVLALAVVATLWPHVVAWPAAAIAAWLGVAWLVKAVSLRRRPSPPRRAERREGGDGPR